MSLYSTKDATYNNQRLGNYQGADFAFFNETAFSAHVLENFFKSMTTLTNQAISGSVLALSLFSPVYGVHHYSAPTAQSKCSMKFGVPSEGMILMLDFGQFAGDANISLFASTGGGVTGVSVTDASGTALSTILVSANGFLKLLCESDGIWTVAQANASVTLQPSA
jgi:hypothetical protein